MLQTETTQATSSNPSEIEHQAFAWRPREWWREQCRDPYFLMVVVLSTAFGDKFQNFGAVHKILAEFLNVLVTASQKKFVSIFRGSYKTTTILGMCVYWFVWAIVEKQVSRICYNTATKENAEIFMGDFHQILQECPLLLAIFPEIPRRDADFKRFTLKKVELGYAKFNVASLDTRQVSRHYTTIINDDLVNDVNGFSDVERRKVIRQWRFQKSIITRYKKHKIGLEIDIGTPYHSKDLMSMIANDKKLKYHRFKIPYALPDDKGRLNLGDKLGILTFPEMFTWEDYQELRDEQGASIFATQYELKTLEEADTICKSEWIRHWTVLPVNYARYMFVDCGGIDDGGRSCPTGIIIFDINESGTYFLLLAQEYWLTPKELIFTMDRLRREFDPDEILVEKEKYSVTIGDTMDHLAPKLNFSFAEPMNRNKHARIRRLKGRFETGRILFAQGMQTLEDRAIAYPDCEYFDMLDALSYGIDYAIPPSRKYQVERPEVKIESTFDKEYNRFLAGLEEADHDRQAYINANF